MPDGRLGRNPNLLAFNACARISKERRYWQTFNLSTHRHWISRIRRKISLSYRISGWFKERDDLSLNVTDLNAQGSILRRICQGKSQLNKAIHDQQTCIFKAWSLSVDTAASHIDQNNSIDEKLSVHYETLALVLDVQQENYSSCRNLYFFIETS